ncbi:hypothetical protein L218DRAFT_560714 [Marasmius fiardii PR-910]|nr:hypothetical protein L218DRAFT_560714 [Marasmius fiardii PR-910]
MLAESNTGVDHYNGTSAELVRKARLEQSQATNPKLVSIIKELSSRLTQSYLYLTVNGGYVSPMGA